MTEEVRRGRAGELEQLWAGDFGDAYVSRNQGAIEERSAFWTRTIARFPSRRVLEVGAAHGENLRHLARLIPPSQLWGIDINLEAIAAMRNIVPECNAVWGVARDLPFRDRWFDLVFTVGLLIHQPDDTLPLVMAEIVRCTNRWVMCGEYHADEPTDVEYRGLTGVLRKRDYGGLFARLFPNLKLRDEGFLNRDDGFDRVTFQVFERVD